MTSPDEVVLLMMASVKSRFSSGSRAAYWMAEDFPVREKSNTYLNGSQINRSSLTFFIEPKASVCTGKILACREQGATINKFGYKKSF